MQNVTPLHKTNPADFVESSFRLIDDNTAEILVMASCHDDAREAVAGIALNREFGGRVVYLDRLNPYERPYWSGAVRRASYQAVLVRRDARGEIQIGRDLELSALITRNLNGGK